MYILRNAVATYTSPLEDWADFSLTLEEIEVSAQQLAAKGRTETASKLILFSAKSRAANSIELTPKKLIQIPVELVAKLENALEFCIAVYSVSQTQGTGISSPTPAIAFIPENSEDRHILTSARGIDWTPHVFFSAKYDIPLEKCATLSIDRPDGAILLAEAMSHKKANGMYVDLMRFFERAFSCKPNAAQMFLTRFLTTDPSLGYSSNEVHTWFGDVRTKFIHADKKEEFYVEGDAIPIIQRMLQAAYDVFLNKKTWRSSCIERRAGARLNVATTDNKGNFRLTKGQRFLTQIQVLDPLGKWPLNLTCTLNPPPKEWVWFKSDLRYSNKVEVQEIEQS